MDFDNNGVSFSLQSAADASKQKCYGFGFLKQDRAINEEDLREFKMAKTSSCGEGVVRHPLQRSNGSTLSAEGHHQMLSFSSPSPSPSPSPNSQPATLPYYHYTSNAFGRNTGINGGSMSMQGVRGPFTPSQWMELEHQALIYKYITANVPIPSYLLNPIRKAFDSAGFSVLRSNALGWGGFQLGFSNTDPEPGRCRRTDGKKWRCSRDAVVDQKYCERHMNRGRHRSRKPVEPQSGIPSITRGVVDKQNTTIPKVSAKDEQYKQQQQQQQQQNANAAFQEFGLVCSDSLLNPLGSCAPDDTKSQHALRQFMDEWPKNHSERSPISWPDTDLQPDRTQLSISIPIDNQNLTARELEMGLGVGTLAVDRNHQRQTNWVPISWDPTSIGGPLGEALHNTSNTIGDCSNAKQLNLIDTWDNSPRLASSPTGVLQRGAFASLSNSSAASSPRSSHCNGIIMNPSLPAL